MLRVLVVDDSAMARTVISSILESDPEIEVIGTASNGQEAVEAVPKLNPDLITMDINMPMMNGLQAVEQIMAYHPVPILIVSTLVKSEVNLAFRGISVGALDAVEKPSTQASPQIRQAFIQTVKRLAKIKVVRHLAGRRRRPLPSINAAPQADTPFKVVAMASSTGGPETLAKILRRLPAQFGAGIVIVQHMSSGFTTGLADWLNKESPITVKVASWSDRIEPGLALIAPDDCHTVVTHGGRIQFSRDAPVNGHRPAGTILFASVARIYGHNSIGVILTGMGNDGAVGIAEIKKAGGKTIAQDEQTSTVFGMPKAAIEMGVIDTVLSVDQIAPKLVSFSIESGDEQIRE